MKVKICTFWIKSKRIEHLLKKNPTSQGQHSISSGYNLYFVKNFDITYLKVHFGVVGLAVKGGLLELGLEELLQLHHLARELVNVVLTK